MSQQIEQTIKCPKCGKELKFKVWKSISTETESAIADIISGDLFRLKCDGCGYSTIVSYPMLFNDMVHNVWIWFVKGEEKSLDMNSIDVAKAIGTRVRIVDSQQSLREKTAIFNAGLDDRVVEIAKAATALHLSKINGIYIQKMFLNVLGDGKYRWELVIDGKRAYAECSKSLFKEIETVYSEDLSSEKDEPLVVDMNWALDILEKEDDTVVPEESEV